VLSVDVGDKAKWNHSRFQIQHASTKSNATLTTTRVFAGDLKARDEWALAISQALLDYQKQKHFFHTLIHLKPRLRPYRNVDDVFHRGQSQGSFDQNFPHVKPIPRLSALSFDSGMKSLGPTKTKPVYYSRHGPPPVSSSPGLRSSKPITPALSFGN
jgi:hypothetical protein